MTRRRGAHEEGSALVIALIFVTVFSLIVAALLSFADVGLRASKSYREQARQAHAADGAIAAATKRYSTTGPCDNYSSPLVEGPAGDAPINGLGTIVRCEGPPPAGSKAVQPVNSLLSLGEGPNDGITSTDELRLLGDVFSNTTVKTTGTMVVQGQVSAVGRGGYTTPTACTGPIQTLPTTPLRCAGATPEAPPDEARGRDPDYNPATTAVPLRRTVPDCPADAWLVPLDPGHYDDAGALNRLTADAGCNDKVVWFRPGTYYFDLTFRGGPGTWLVNNPSIVVVGGTPRGWDPKAPSRPSLSVPGSCKTEGDPAPSDGVQLIAGGETRLQVDKGRMELCATPSRTDQQIALFGLGSEDDPKHVLEGTDITPQGFSNVVNAQSIGETPSPATSTATLSAELPSASLAFNAFRPGVPLGSVIDGVSLRVVHQEDKDPVELTYTAAFPDSGCLSPTPLPPSGPDGSRVDLAAACGLSTPEAFAGLGVTYGAALAAGSTDADLAVDGLVIEVSYRTPTTNKPTAVLAHPGFTKELAALEIGEVGMVDDRQERLTADAELASGGAASASLTVAGLGDPPLHADAAISSVKLRIAHRDQGDMTGPTVTLPFGGGVCTAVLPHRPDGIADDRMDLLKDCGLDSPAELRGLTATFTAGLSPGGAAAVSKLDGMWLEVVSDVGTGALPAAVRRAGTAASSTFTGPDAAKTIGETPDPVTADANMANGTTSATLTVGSFNSLPLAPGSKIDSAKLRVTHREVINVAAVTLGATVPDVPGQPGGTCPPATLAPSPPEAFATQEVDLGACGLRSPDQLKDLTATYSASAVSLTDAQEPETATTTDFNKGQTDGRSINGNTADVVLSDGVKETASITLDGYDLAPPPTGSSFDAATLRIAHRDEGDLDPQSVTVTVTFDGNTCTLPKPLELRRGAIGEDTVDLRACGLSDPSKLTGPNGLEVVYKVDLAPGAGKVASDFLDGIVLDLTYRPPAVDRLDGIELDVVYQAPRLRPLCGTCELLKVAPEPTDVLRGNTRFVSAGTVYAPSAGVDIAMYGLTSQVLTRGLIARTMKLALQPDPGYKRPTGAIPPEEVIFTAYPERSLAATSAASPPPNGFTNPDNAKVVSEQPTALAAEATLDAARPSAGLDLGGFDRGDLRDGATIDAAVLRIRHQDEGNTVEVTVKVGADVCAVQTLTPRPNRLVEDQVDLGDCRGKLADPTKVAGVTVSYKVTLDPARQTGVAFLDGITLQVLSGPMVQASVTFERKKATVRGWSVTR